MRNNPIIFLFRKLWQYSESNKKGVVLFFVLFLFADVIWLLEPVVVAKILNSVQEKGVTKETLPTLALYLSFFIGIVFMGWVFHGPARVIETKNAFFVRANYRKYLLDGVMALPASWHTDHHSGDTIDKIEKGTRALYQFAGNSFTIIDVVVRFIVAYGVLVYFNIHTSYIVLGMMTLTVTMILKFDKRLIAQLSQVYRMENTISAKIFDVISNITTVIILRIETLVSKAIFKKIMQPFGLYVKERKLNEIKWFLVAMCGSFTLFLVMFSYLFVNVRTGKVILIGTLYLLYEYVSKIVSIFYNFAYMYGDMMEQKTAVMNAEEVAKEFKEKRFVDEVVFPPTWSTLDVEKLTFSYHSEEGGDLHLDRVSFSIHRGEKIAFIGDSGSGKTTMLKLMRGLYSPRRVACTLDGVILPHGFFSISLNIALIPQDPEIFATTILENITVGVPHTVEYIRRFTDIAKLTEVVERLPKKFHSSIVEKGVNLSGGEKQRLALARGLLASVDKEIILLDEPTSSVDSRNERLIYENIFNAFKGKVIISSVHRLHLLPMFNTIYFFREGKIIASGSFEMLLTTSEDFHALWEKYNKSQK